MTEAKPEQLTLTLEQVTSLTENNQTLTLSDGTTLTGPQLQTQFDHSFEQFRRALVQKLGDVPVDKTKFKLVIHRRPITFGAGSNIVFRQQPERKFEKKRKR